MNLQNKIVCAIGFAVIQVSIIVCARIYKKVDPDTYRIYKGWLIFNEVLAAAALIPPIIFG